MLEKKKIATSCEDGRAALKVDCFKKTRAYLFSPLTSNKESLKTILCTNFQVKLVAFAQCLPASDRSTYYTSLLRLVGCRTDVFFFYFRNHILYAHLVSCKKLYFCRTSEKNPPKYFIYQIPEKIFLISGYYLFIIQYGNLPLSPNTKNQRSLSNMHIFL